MFKNLKQKLGESLANSPARNLLSVDQEKQVSALSTTLHRVYFREYYKIYSNGTHWAPMGTIVWPTGRLCIGKL